MRKKPCSDFPKAGGSLSLNNHIHHGAVAEWYDQVSKDIPRVLEIGCETCEKVTIDISQKMINKQIALQMDAHDLDFEPGTFDEVRAFGSLENVDLPTVFKEVSRVLKIKGVFKFRIQKDSPLIRFYIRYFRKALEKDKYFKQKKYKVGYVNDLLSNFGLTVFKIKPLNWGAIYEIWTKK